MTEEIIQPSYKYLSNYQHQCKKCLDRNLLVECECGCHELMFRRDKHGKTRYFIKGHIVRVNNTKPKKQRTEKDITQFHCQKCRDKNFLIECGCGTCNEVIFKFHSNGLPRKYAFNHHFRLEKNKRDQRGEKGSNWRGGMYFDDGYWMLTNKWDHPNAQKSDGAISRHVYNFTVREGVLFCCMLKWGRVHHKIPIDENGTDDLENLEGMMLSKHLSHHHKGVPKPANKKNFGGRICLLCGNSDTWIDPKTGYESWYIFEDGFICNKCNSKIK